jgi:hypothetical protein
VVAWRPAGSDGGRRVLVQLLAAAVAVVLTVAILVSQFRSAPESRAADPGRRERAAEGAAAPTTGPPPTAPPPRAAAGNLLEDPSFEGGLGRWRAAQGTRLARVAGARSGAWAASLTAGGPSGPAMGIGEAGRCQARRQYAVTVWLRASHPGTLVRVDLAEQSGGRRLAVDTAGAVLDGQDWRPLEVRHVTHRPGAALAIEIAAVELPDGGQVLVDDLTLRESPGPARP